MARENEAERHRGVEVRAGDMPDGVNAGKDHEAECDRYPDVSERVSLRIDHYGARAREHEHERPDYLGAERPGETAQFPASSATRRRTRASISSRIPRTVSRSLPAGSSSSQSS